MRQNPCGTQESNTADSMAEGENLLVCSYDLLFVLFLSYFPLFRVLAFVSLLRVFVWLVEYLTADHAISFLFWSIPGISFGQVLRLWGKLPALRRHNLAMWKHQQPQRSWALRPTLGTSAFHLLLLWHFCRSTIAVLVVHDALHYSGVLYVVSNLLQTLHTVPGTISQVHNDTSIIPYMGRGILLHRSPTYVCTFSLTIWRAVPLATDPAPAPPLCTWNKRTAGFQSRLSKTLIFELVSIYLVCWIIFVIPTKQYTVLVSFSVFILTQQWQILTSKMAQ